MILKRWYLTVDFNNNALSHRIIAIIELVEGINRLDWPAVSLHLYRIEHTWRMFSSPVAASRNPSRSLQENIRDTKDQPQYVHSPTSCHLSQDGTLHFELILCPIIQVNMTGTLQWKSAWSRGSVTVGDLSLLPHRVYTVRVCYAVAACRHPTRSFITNIHETQQHLSNIYCYFHQIHG